MILSENKIDSLGRGVTVCFYHTLRRYNGDIPEHHGTKNFGSENCGLNVYGGIHDDAVLVKIPKPLAVCVDGHCVTSSRYASPPLAEEYVVSKLIQ